MVSGNSHTFSRSDLSTLQLASELESLNRLDKFMEDVQKKYVLDDDTFARMLTCTNEACINAIVHGNKSDKKLRVYINLELNRDGFLVIQIGDEGQGFDYENVADPTTTENREKTSGRGIYIIRKLADRCLFNSIGNQIELHFKI